MRRLTVLWIAACTLIATTVLASVQPEVPVSEDAPLRVNAGLFTGLINNDSGFGMDALGIGLGFVSNVGYDFEFGLSVSGNWAAAGQRIFTSEAEKNSGMQTNVELMTRFMPEVAEDFHAGLVLGLDWGTQFGGELLKPIKEKIAFGDLALRVGIGLSSRLSDMVSVYLTPQATLTKIRWYNDKASEQDKKNANYWGLSVPFGFMFAASENVGWFIEAKTQFTDFKNFGKSWREEVALGVSFAM